MKRGSVRASKRNKPSRSSTIQEEVEPPYTQPTNNIKRLSIEVEVNPPGRGTEVWHTESSSSGGMSSSKQLAKLSMHDALSTKLFTVHTHLMQNSIRNFQNFPFFLRQKTPTRGVTHTYHKSTTIFIFLSWIYWLDLVLLDISCQNGPHSLLKLEYLKQLKFPNPSSTFQTRSQSHQATEAYHYLYSDWWLKFHQSLDIGRTRKFNREAPNKLACMFTLLTFSHFNLCLKVFAM